MDTKLKKDINEVTDILNLGVLGRLLEEVKKGNLGKSSIREVFSDILHGVPLEGAIKKEKASDDEIEEEVRNVVKERPGLSENAYMGVMMTKFKGKVDARKMMEIIKRVVGD